MKLSKTDKESLKVSLLFILLAIFLTIVTGCASG